MRRPAIGDPPKRLVIFGAGTLAQLVYAYVARDTDYEIAACTVHLEHLKSADLNGLPTTPFEELERDYPSTEYSLFVAVGYTQVNRRRAEIFQNCVERGYHLATIVSSRAYCWDDLRIGRNCLVFDAVVIEPNVQIGDDVIVWSGSQISHDSSIGDHCFLGPNAVVLGNVSVGARSFIGGNATVRNGVAIAEDCVVGAGAIVKAHTAAGDIYPMTQAQPIPGRNSRDGVDL